MPSSLQPCIDRVTRDRAGAPWLFALDFPKVGAPLRLDVPLVVKGWVVHHAREVELVRVVREQDERPIGVLEHLRPRPDVAAKHASVAAAGDRVGFQGTVTIDRPGRYRIEALVGDDARALATLSVADPSAPRARLMLVHIPKTGGTSVKSFLRSAVPAGDAMLELERRADWMSLKSLADLSRKTVLAGHIRFAVLKDRFDAWEYVKVTILRRPLDQLISHMAHVRHLSDPGMEAGLRGEAPHVQALSAKLAGTELGDPAALQRFIRNLDERERFMWDNCQTRYLSALPGGSRVSHDDLKSARQNLREMDVVGFTEDLSAFCIEVAELMGWPLPVRAPQENRLGGKYGLDGADERIARVLRPLYGIDERLYEGALRMHHRKESA